MRPASAAIAAATIAIAACTPAPFQRAISRGRWNDAAAAFSADSSLMNDERALFDAGELFSSPVRGAYDPARAQLLLRRLLDGFPETKYNVEARDRLALVDAVLRERDSSSARTRMVEGQIAQLTAESRRTRAMLDSVTARNDALERSSARLEADLKDKDEQLRALRTELARLKEIDLKPRPAAKPPQR